jgi:hypothetical protein
MSLQVFISSMLILKLVNEPLNGLASIGSLIHQVYNEYLGFEVLGQNRFFLQALKPQTFTPNHLSFFNLKEKIYE